MNQKYIDIEKELISKYKINIVKHSTCRSRTHAHCDGTRRICKWEARNSVQNLFELAHEIGHIMTKTSTMRRCESEFYATVWAIQELNKYNITLPYKTVIQPYQNYIYRELERGLRRGGSNYMPIEYYNLDNALQITIKAKPVPKDAVIAKAIRKHI